MDAKDPISSGEFTVFQTYADLVNSERATMWARHNAMLVANSLILSALAISPTHNRWPDIALLAAGLLISGAWLAITIEGWSAVRHHATIAGTRGILFRPLAEPLCPERLRRSPGQDLAVDPGGDRRFRGDVSRARLRPSGRLKSSRQSATP